MISARRGESEGLSSVVVEFETDSGNVRCSTRRANRIELKQFAMGYPSTAAVDAGLELRARGIRPEDIESVEVRTAVTAARVAGNVHPETAFGAKFSVSYRVAAALVLGSVRLRAFEPEALRNPLDSG